MGSTLIRKLAILVLATASGAALVPAPVAAAPSPRPATITPVRAAPRVTMLPYQVIDRALRADGVRVRAEQGRTVHRVNLRGSLSRLAGGARNVYRVTVRGRFEPRALRYVVRAGGRAIGYGIPRADQRAIRAVTTDAAVLTERITVRYGAGPAAPGASAPAPRGSGGLGAAAPGPEAVTRTSYDLGDKSFQPAGLGAKVELAADVHHPTDLAGGPYPLLLFLHGNHSSCYRGERAGYVWPCRPGWTALPNHEGYAYLARRLASWGFIVVSVSGNGVNVHGNRLLDSGMRQRGLLLEKHLDLWNGWNTSGGDPFGSDFVGAIDITRIGVMGHSRGGEGAVWNVIVDRERATPYGIDAVLPLAPVDFTRETVNDVPLGVILPYCDGDVYDLQGVHFFDDARYRVPGDTSPKATVTVFGANHNFFNTVWSPSSGIPDGFDDGWNCPGRLTEIQQRRAGIVYIVSFFRRYVGGTLSRGRIWSGESTPANLAPARTAVTYLAPDTASDRMDVDRFTHPGDLGTNEQGGSVIPSNLGIYGWCSNTMDTPCVPGEYSFSDIHLSYSWFGGPVAPGLQEAVLGWTPAQSGVPSLRFQLPPGSRDVDAYDLFAFRTVPNPGYQASLQIAMQDLTVVLEDGSGNRVGVAASDVGNDPLAFPLRGRRFLEGHVIMNQIRFPLSGFAGVDLSDVRAVELVLDRVELGVINVSDLAFWRGVGA